MLVSGRDKSSKRTWLHANEPISDGVIPFLMKVNRLRVAIGGFVINVMAGWATPSFADSTGRELNKDRKKKDN